MLRRSFLCGHRPRAGRLNAIQGMPVQFRLAAPIFISHIKKNTAGASLRNGVSKTLWDRGSTGTPCHAWITDLKAEISNL